MSGFVSYNIKKLEKAKQILQEELSELLLTFEENNKIIVENIKVIREKSADTYDGFTTHPLVEITTKTP